MENILKQGETAAFDFSLEIGGQENNFESAVRYNTNLFDKATIERMGLSLPTHISRNAYQSGRSAFQIGDAESVRETKFVLGWNATSAEIPQQCLHELITVQVEQNPDTPAIICNGRPLTYSDLERKSNQLAAYLLEKGVGPGTLVGIFLPRSEDLLLSQLAILKSGGAYVPLDLTYPAERLAYMLQDARPKLVITNSILATQLPDNIQKICLDTEMDAISNFPSQRVNPSSDGNAAIYVTYTSGSTGRPKGVVTFQRGALNYLHHILKTFQLQAGERVIQITPLSFDAACRDTLGALSFGGTVVLMDDEQMRNPGIHIFHHSEGAGQLYLECCPNHVTGYSPSCVRIWCRGELSQVNYAQWRSFAGN